MVHTSKASPINLSFSGCGFLGLYHVGVICAFKEHAPEVLENKMAGCSAGALAAACAMCGCCVGQMCSDVLEIAIRARSRALGPFHPTFSIVDIIRNGLRRILPPNAHEICSGRLFISLTKWKENKNVLISQFDSREELIQVLICSSFVPLWSGLIPPKFRDEYYWDGGLSNNNPMLDEWTILVSPFAGESDICPRGESGSFFSWNFQGTDVSCTQENVYRLRHALFPPSISALKQICWRGYVDGLKFLQTRNMIRSSDLDPKATFSTVLGSDYSEPPTEEEKELANGGIAHGIDQMYEDLEDIDEEMSDEEDETPSDIESNGESVSQITYSPFCEKVTAKKELPTPVFAVFAHARHQEEYPIRSYFTQFRLYRLGSYMMLPVTLPLDLTYAATKRVLSIFRSSDETSNPSLPTRAVNYLWSFLVDDEAEKKSCYHVNDCQCTDDRGSTFSGPGRSRPRLSRVRRRSHRLSQDREMLNATMNTAGSSSTSTRTDSETDDERDFGSVTHSDDPCQHSPTLLPQPDLVTSTISESYCQHLQKMADLATEYRLKMDPSMSTTNRCSSVS